MKLINKKEVIEKEIVDEELQTTFNEDELDGEEVTEDVQSEN